MLAVFVENNFTGHLAGNFAINQQVEDEFNRVLLEKGFRLVSHLDKETLMKELKFQRSGWTINDSSHISNMHNASGIVTITISNYNAAITISGRIINTDDGELLGQGSYGQLLRKPEDLPRAVGFLASVLARGFPSRIR
jgi:hypothetical protein